MTRHIVQFSGGIDSWAAAQRVVAEHGRDDVTLLFADTRIEHPDLYRFLYDAEQQLEIPITRVADGRTPWEVFFDVKFLGNSRLAPCSHILKQKVCRDWLEKNCDPADTILYIGIDATAKDKRRGPAITRNWEPWRAEFPMTAEPHLSKKEMRAWAKDLRVEPPEMYEMGFEHNNCGGACVRAGQKQWRLLLATRPEVYAEVEAFEQEFRRRSGKDVAILTRTRGGVKRPLTLRTLRLEVEAETVADTRVREGR